MFSSRYLLSLFFLSFLFFPVSLFAANYNLPDDQWRIITLPGNPPASENTVAKVFGDDIPGGVYGVNWVLYQYQGRSYEPLAEAHVLEQGRGYWIIQKTGSPVMLTMPAGSSETPDTYALKIASATGSNKSQWTLSGNPFSSSQTLGDFFLKTDTGACITPCDLDKAADERILHNKVWTYDGEKYVPKDTQKTLNPWDGFWAASLENSQGRVLSLQKEDGPDNELVRDFKLPTPLFSNQSAWQQRADTASVLVASNDKYKLGASRDQILTTYRILMGDTYYKDSKDKLVKTKVMDPTAIMWMEVEEWTIPIFRASNTEIEIDICTYDGKISLKPSPMKVAAPAPDRKIRPSGPGGVGSDGALVLFNIDQQTSWEFWQATVERNEACDSEGGGGVISNQLLEAGYATSFNVTEDGTSSQEEFSASASGYSHLAGLLLPEDFESGEIRHALKFAIPGVRNLSHEGSKKEGRDYKYPATSTE